MIGRNSVGMGASWKTEAISRGGSVGGSRCWDQCHQAVLQLSGRAQPAPFQAEELHVQVLVNNSLAVYFQFWYLWKFLNIWIPLAWRRLGIPQCRFAPAFKLGVRRGFSLQQSPPLSQVLTLRMGLEYTLCVDGLVAICYPICSCGELTWRRSIAGVAPFCRTVGAAFDSYLWHLDVHGCYSQPCVCRPWEGWSTVNSSEWAVLVYFIVLVLSTCLCMRMKISHQESSLLFFNHWFSSSHLSCPLQAVLCLLTLLLLWSLLAQDFLQNLALVPRFISFCCSCDLPGGFVQSSCSELQTNWRKSITTCQVTWMWACN